jgi:hypothetical protein
VLHQFDLSYLPRYDCVHTRSADPTFADLAELLQAKCVKLQTLIDHKTD